MAKYLINEQYDVEDPNATKGYGKGEKREDYADAWRNTGNAVLIGLAGSGRRQLADALAEKTGLPVSEPASAEEAVQMLDGKGTIVVLEDVLVETAEVQSVLHGSGKVFYLLADSKTLSERVAERDGVEDRDTLWRELSARLAVMEPIFYSGLHFILQPTETFEEMVEDALEKMRL